MNLMLAGCGVDSSGGISAQQENQESQNSATLSWEPPTTNADGTPLNDLAGYKVYYGKAPGDRSTTKDVGLPDTTEYTINNLDSGTRYYFAVTAYDTSGNESDFSEEVYKDIP